MLLLVGGKTLLAQPSGLEKRPNIILIMADDLGYAELGSYGQEILQTPNLDAMAEEGIRFTDFYAGVSICKPSRESLMTGMHTGNTFVKGNFLSQSEGDFATPFDLIGRNTIAEYVKDAGYRTAMTGKWGLGGAGSGSGPNSRGFDYSLAYLSQMNAHNYFPPFLWENEKMIHLEENRLPEEVNDNMEGAQRDNAGPSLETQRTYSHHLFADKALELIEKSGSDEPFFLYLPFTLPHGRFEIPDDSPWTEMQWSQTQKNIAAMISLLDRDVGRIMELLKEKGIDNNTVLLFTSDNGPTATANRFFDSNGPLRGIKGDLYEGGIRVPLIVWWPGVLEPGVSTHVAAAWDLLPTIAEIAGVEYPADEIDGISFLPLLLGNEQPKHEFLYWELYTYNYRWGNEENTRPRNWLEHRAVRYGKWKAVMPNIFTEQNAVMELYDLDNDIGETTDVSALHPKIVQKIEAFMISNYNTNPYFPLRP